MQVKLSYAEAQQLIIDVASQLIALGEDVVVTLPDGSILIVADDDVWTPLGAVPFVAGAVEDGDADDD